MDRLPTPPIRAVNPSTGAATAPCYAWYAYESAKPPGGTRAAWASSGGPMLRAVWPGHGAGPRRDTRGAAYSRRNTYPTPRTVCRNRGAPGFASISLRSQCTCTSTVRVSPA